MLASVAVTELQRWLEVGRAWWPGVTLDEATLGNHLERLGIAVDANHPHAADLYLAAACATGGTDAIAAFDRELVPIVRSAARRIDGSGDFADEIVQLARERLLVAAAPAESRIADYAGQGALRAWVRIAALRIAMNRLRDRRRDVLVDDEAFFDVVAEGSDDERRQTRERYGAACSEALRVAFTAITVRERNLLRMHHLHGLTVDELAPTLRVHRATVARWIASAREHLLAEMRAGLRARLAIGEGTVDSILRELAGRIDISVTRLLAE
jgi:RNA polymerase sigma-70 factor (ECF subfamily)